MYESLHNLFYKDADRYQEIYNARFANIFTTVFPVELKQFGRKNAYSAFYCQCQDLSLLQERIFFAYNECARLIGEVPEVAIRQFLNTCLINEIKSTNDIEGVHSTRREIHNVLDTMASQRHNLRLGSIVNKYEKLVGGERLQLESSQDIRDIYDDLLSDEIRQDNPDNLPDGEIFRRNSVDVVSPAQKTIHRGVNPEQNIIQSMDKALAILNDKEIPLLVRIGIFHCLFGYIHPFYDGNGRTSRFIASCLLAEKLHPAVALQLSVLIKEHKNKYYKMFALAEAESNRGDLTPFVLGFLELVLQAIELTTEQLQESFGRYRLYRKALLGRIKANKAMVQLYDILLQATVFSDVGISIRELSEILGKTPNTVYGYIRSIPEEQLFVRVEKNRKFIELNYEFLLSLE